MISGKHALNVAIENGCPALVSQCHDRTGCRAAYAGQRLKRLKCAWKLAGIGVHDHLRRLMHVSGSGVVAKARPKAQNLIKGGFGQIGHGRKFRHKPGVIRNDC